MHFFKDSISIQTELLLTCLFEWTISVLEDLKLCNVLLSNEDDIAEEVTTADKFLLEVLRHCLKLKELSLSMEMLTDHSGKN